MMIFDRQKQRLLLEGKEYTPGDIHGLVAEGEGNHPSAIWDLYLFLNLNGLMIDPVTLYILPVLRGHLKNCLSAKTDDTECTPDL